MPVPDKGYVVTDENALIMDFYYRDPMTSTDKPVAKAQPIWGRPSRAYSDPEVENVENVEKLSPSSHKLRGRWSGISLIGV